MYLHNFEGHCCPVNDIRMDDFAREYLLLDDVGVHAQWAEGLLADHADSRHLDTNREGTFVALQWGQRLSIFPVC